MIDSILTFCDEVLSNPIWFYVITLLIKIVICFAITILFIPICVYIERRVAAWIQDRVGPNRAGIPLSIFRRFGMKSDLPFKKTLDYFGMLPTFLTDLSPFHGTVIFTSMGSLGIPPIVHHLYNFGTLPMFIAFGAKRKAVERHRAGQAVVRQDMAIMAVMGERGWAG